MSDRNRQSFASRFATRAALLWACALFLAQAGAQPAPAPSAPGAPAAPAGASAATAAPISVATVPLPSSAMSAATAAEIQKINESMTLLQAQLNQLELQAKIASKKKEISGPTGEARQSSFDAKSGNPSVMSVAGLRGQLEATLIFPGGVTQRVRQGDLIDDRRVAKVAINEVVLTDLKGRNVQRLAFGSAPVTREKTPLAGSPGPLPAPYALPAPLPTAGR